MTRLLLPLVLALFAAPAAAEMRISGDARMGVAYDSSGDGRMRFVNRIRIGFTLTGSTDSGIDYAFTVRLDEADQAARGTGGTVSIAAGRHRLSFGDVDDARASAVGRLHGVGLTGLGDGHKLDF